MSSSIDAYYEARRFMVGALRDELVGSEKDDVLHEQPLNRFVAGILYPQSVPGKIEEERANPDADGEGEDHLEPSDTPVSLSHVRYPSACGLSFNVAAEAPIIDVTISAARYTETNGSWHRSEHGTTLSVVLSEPGTDEMTVADGLSLRVVVRRVRDGVRPVTLALVNTVTASAVGHRDSYAWFQPELTVRCPSGFLDRPFGVSTGLEDADIDSGRLLFRDVRNLAVGHGCAVEWVDGDEVTELRVTFIPSHAINRAETSIKGISLPMSRLADGGSVEALTDLIDRYEAWIADQRDRVHGLPDGLRGTAVGHLDRAAEASLKMREGMARIQLDGQARRAFELMNLAMYNQRNKQEYIRNQSAPSSIGGPSRWRSS
ncbi:MAG: hypothetical protein ACYC1E_12135 [Propionibacteriaceae bacterium]